MAREDRLKKVQEAGVDFLETARARAEEFLREMSRAGEGTSGRAQGALDDLFETSRKGTDQLLGSIRREVTSQLTALGLVTRSDLDALEERLTARLTEVEKAAEKSVHRAAGAAAPAPADPAVTSAARPPADKAPAARTAGAKTASPAKRAPAARKAPAKKAAG